MTIQSTCFMKTQVRRAGAAAETPERRQDDSVLQHQEDVRQPAEYTQEEQHSRGCHSRGQEPATERSSFKRLVQNKTIY